jgi:hypothetical protein
MRHWRENGLTEKFDGWGDGSEPISPWWTDTMDVITISDKSTTQVFE